MCSYWVLNQPVNEIQRFPSVLDGSSICCHEVQKIRWDLLSRRFLKSITMKAQRKHDEWVTVFIRKRSWRTASFENEGKQNHWCQKIAQKSIGKIGAFDSARIQTMRQKTVGLLLGSNLDLIQNSVPFPIDISNACWEEIYSVFTFSWILQEMAWNGENFLSNISFSSSLKIKFGLGHASGFWPPLYIESYFLFFLFVFISPNKNQLNHFIAEVVLVRWDKQQKDTPGFIFGLKIASNPGYLSSSEIALESLLRKHWAKSLILSQ